MDLLMLIAIAALGVHTYKKQEIKLNKTRVCKGRPAQAVGVMLMLVLPLTFVACVILIKCELTCAHVLGRAFDGLTPYALAWLFALPPAALAHLHAEDVKTNRNAACPCGSGKRFKKCCRKKAA